MIQPALVAGLGRRAVAAVAAGKHHTLLCTTAGEVWTFGSNRHGQLGYAVDSQPTPRRVASLRARVVAVAAANKHSVAVAAGGEVFTWGSNVLGQVRAAAPREQGLWGLAASALTHRPAACRFGGATAAHPAPCTYTSPALPCMPTLTACPPCSWATAHQTPAPALRPAWWKQ